MSELGNALGGVKRGQLPSPLLFVQPRSSEAPRGLERIGGITAVAGWRHAADKADNELSLDRLHRKVGHGLLPTRIPEQDGGADRTGWWSKKTQEAGFPPVLRAFPSGRRTFNVTMRAKAKSI